MQPLTQVFNPLGWTLHHWLPVSLQQSSDAEPCFTAKSGEEEVGIGCERSRGRVREIREEEEGEGACV